MKNSLIYLVIVFIAISCKKESRIYQPKNTYEQQKLNNKSLENKENISCDDIIYNIIASSDLKLYDYKNYFVRVENIKNDSITVKVYVENNLSDDPKQKQIVESVIAWLLFLPNEEKLFNVTADPENPIKVNYKTKDISSIYSLCNIPKKKKTNKIVEDEDTQKECKNITVEMGKGEECILRNTNIQNVYSDIIKNENVDDSKYLLSSIPKNNRVIEINKNGLINIEYKIAKNRIEILFNYDGGVTEVIIEKKEDNILRHIVYYAD